MVQYAKRMVKLENNAEILIKSDVRWRSENSRKKSFACLPLSRKVEFESFFETVAETKQTKMKNP
jgi:hypothetical protein